MIKKKKTNVGWLVSYFVYWHINLRELFDAKTIFVEQ